MGGVGTMYSGWCWYNVWWGGVGTMYGGVVLVQCIVGGVGTMYSGWCWYNV